MTLYNIIIIVVSNLDSMIRNFIKTTEPPSFLIGETFVHKFFLLYCRGYTSNQYVH